MWHLHFILLRSLPIRRNGDQESGQNENWALCCLDFLFRRWCVFCFMFFRPGLVASGSFYGMLSIAFAAITVFSFLMFPYSMFVSRFPCNDSKAIICGAITMLEHRYVCLCNARSSRIQECIHVPLLTSINLWIPRRQDCFLFYYIFVPDLNGPRNDTYRMIENVVCR